MKNTRYPILGLLTLVCALSCAGRENVTTLVILSVGEVKMKSPGEQYTPVRAGRVIARGDVIQTGAASHLTIQIGDCGIVQIAPNTTLEARTLLDSGEGELFLSKGTIASRIDKLGKWKSYTVKTPTAIAAVRGTVFSVSYDSVSSTVGVSRGKVQVFETASNKTELVQGGKAADVRGGITIRELGRTESLVMSKVEAVTFIEDAGNAAPEVIEKKGRSFLPELEKIDRKIKEESVPATLEGIRARYGRIDVVTLYSGRVYRGVILDRGDTLKILIPGGAVQVPARKVKQTVSQ